MNFEGLKEKIEQLIAGGKIEINQLKFQNDMTSFQSADDVLTLLIHLGYLTYDSQKKTCAIPNQEVQQEFVNCMEDGGWNHIIDAIQSSDELLEYTFSGNEKEVAKHLQ